MLPAEILRMVLEHLDFFDAFNEHRLSTIVQAYISEATHLVYTNCGSNEYAYFVSPNVSLLQARHVCQAWRKIALDILLGQDLDRLQHNERMKKVARLACLEKHIQWCVLPYLGY